MTLSFVLLVSLIHQFDYSVVTLFDEHDEITKLSSNDPLVRHEAFIRLWEKTPSSMTPLIDLVKSMKPSISPNGNKYYEYNVASHYAIRLLGHHRVVDAIEPLVQQIGYPNHDQFATITGSCPSTVQALSNIGEKVIPHVLKKLGRINQDGISRHNCLLLISLIHNRDFYKPIEIIKEKLADSSLTPEERTNLEAALNYAKYEFRHPKLPHPNEWYWR